MTLVPRTDELYRRIVRHVEHSPINTLIYPKHGHPDGLSTMAFRATGCNIDDIRDSISAQVADIIVRQMLCSPVLKYKWTDAAFETCRGVLLVASQSITPHLLSQSVPEEAFSCLFTSSLVPSNHILIVPNYVRPFFGIYQIWDIEDVERLHVEWCLWAQTYRNLFLVKLKSFGSILDMMVCET